MGKVFFGVWKMGGGRGRDIIRKYTFESGARPAAGTASTLYTVMSQEMNHCEANLNRPFSLPN